MKTYRIQSLLSSVTLRTSREGCVAIKRGHSYDVNRQEARNMLSYARQKDGLAAIVKG